MRSNQISTPAPNETPPSATTGPGPKRCTNRPPRIDTGTTISGPGASDSPATRIESCQIDVRNSTLPNSIAANPAANTPVVTQASHSVGTRSAGRSSTGTAWRAERSGTHASATAATANASSTGCAPQPWSGASTSA